MFEEFSAHAQGQQQVPGAGLSAAAAVGRGGDRLSQPVVLVLAPAYRGTEAQALLRKITPCWRILVACSPTEATAILVMGRVDLLLMDLKCEPLQPLAMIHLLARLAPTAKLMAFDDSECPTPIHPYRTHPWCDLERLVETLDARRRDLRATPGKPHSVIEASA